MHLRCSWGVVCLENHAVTTRASRYGRSSSRISSCLCRRFKMMVESSHAAEGRPRMRAHRLQTSGSAVNLRSSAATRRHGHCIDAGTLYTGAGTLTPH